jgi:hypothetical protein
MNKIDQMQNLADEASNLDNLGLYKHANEITKILVKLAQEKDDEIEIIEPKKVVTFSDKDGNQILQLENGKEVKIPKNLELREKFAEKDFLLSYDPEKERFLYISDDRKTAFPLDELDKAREIRDKKVDAWTQIGLRGFFGDLRLPNLNKIIRLEPIVRKSVIDIARTLKPLGDEIKEPVRKKITDPATKAIQNLGGNVAGGKTPEFAAAEKNLGKSKDRSSAPGIVPDTAKNVPGSETVKLLDPSIDGSTDVKTDGSTEGKTNGSTDGAKTDPVIKSNGSTLKDIHNPKDLLFWSMMVGNGIKFNSWSKDKEKEYYSKDRYNNTLSMINKLTSSNWVKNINPDIAGFKDGAISELDSRTSITASKTMKKQVLASMNEICEELDSMDLVEASNTITKMMMKLAQEDPSFLEQENLVDTPQVTAWTNFARSLAKKDPDFIPPIKPKVSMYTCLDVTEKALAEYHRYKENKKQPYKFTLAEENQIKRLATEADKAR